MANTLMVPPEIALDELEEEEDTQKDKFLTFHVAGEDYGIEIAYVTEIIGMQSITEVPDMPAFVKGVINLRGKVIPVMDVRTRFNFDRKEYDERTCIIVVEIQDNCVGLVVDAVNEVMAIPESQIEPPPSTGADNGNRCLKGLGKIGHQVKIILDIEHLLYQDQSRHLPL